MAASFVQSVSQIFKGAGKAFQTFPAAIACALAFAVVTMVRIQLDWPQQEPYNFLFNCMHWSFALGSVFSLAAITFAQSRFNQARAFLTANMLGITAAAVTFLILYLASGTYPDLAASRYMVVSGLAEARVIVAILVSLSAFIILAGYPKEQSDFSRSLFMTQKALFIALVYGGVITAGASGVAGAVEALLYPGMSEKVYMYIATSTGFLGFTIFVGYFPDLRRGQVDEHREAAQKQPRFIEILFEYILVPVVLALTVVLLLWAGRTVVTGKWPLFVQLYGIAASYVAGGIWLHVMVTHLTSGLAKFYRKVYPTTALIILAFEAWALFIQLGKTGLKTTEYSFALIWVIAVVSAIILLIQKAGAHNAIAALVCAAAVFSVLPVAGYQALPVTAQVGRLEKLLVSQGMLVGDQMVPAAAEPDLAVRESITDAVSFLAGARDAKLPAWFDRRLGDSTVFKAKLGFEQTWPKPVEIYNGPGMGISLMLPPGAVDISEYGWAVNMQNNYGKGNTPVTVKGAKGTYRIDWTVTPPSGVATLRIEMDGRVILEQDMNSYIDQVSSKYPPGEGKPTEATFEDMSLRLETTELAVLLVFNNIDIGVDPRRDKISYSLNLGTIYLKEKP